MVQGLKFLSKKAFHPKNVANQKKVWEREQQTKQEAQRAEERRKTLQREREDEELRRSRGEVKLEFMYQAPPGVNKKESEEKGAEHDPMSKSTGDSADLTQEQPGDDAAAAAFRRLLAGNASADGGTSKADERKVAFGTVLHGSTVDTALPDRKALSALEQAVGRKKTDAPTTTLEEQLERFPALKNAPRAKGTAGDSAAVQFKPLGAQIRNVRCLTCGQWGHSRGDRECQVSGWDPFSAKSLTSTSKTQALKPQNNKNWTAEDEDSDSTASSEGRRRKKHRKRKHGQKRKSKKHHKKRSRDRRDRNRSNSVESGRKRRKRSLSEDNARRKRSGVDE